MARLMRRGPRGRDAGDETAVTVVRPPLGESAVIPHGAEIGAYRIGPQLGRGGMGVVYKAHHVHLDRPAAVKVLTQALAHNEEFRERFMRESQMAATLQHPNVVTVYDAGEQDGLLYLAMQFVAGTDLRRLLELEGPLEPHRLVAILMQVGAALDAAHDCGLVHRDVKPANILIDVDRAFLGDFGLTKRFDASGGLTGVGQIVGTVDYLAPEQIEGGRVDARTDLYALGCVAYEGLTGRPPHSKDSDIAVLFAHVREEPAPASSLREGITPGADAAVSRALAKNPADRHGSCREFVFDLAVELGVDTATLVAREPTSHVVVASDDPATCAVVRGSLANLGVVVVDVTSGDALDRASRRRFDALIADWRIGADQISRLRAAMPADEAGCPPKLLLLVPRQAPVDRAIDGIEPDEELAQPFSGMQLALKLRRLLGPQAVRA